MNVCTKCDGYLDTVLEIFQSGPKWRTESCGSKAIKHKNVKTAINRQKTAGREVKYLQQISMLTSLTLVRTTCQSTDETETENSAVGISTFAPSCQDHL